MATQLARFYHHPDGRIKIRNTNSDNGELDVSLSEFLTFEPGYALPAGFTAQEYIPTVKYTRYKGSTQYGAPIPNATLDGYIANLASYINQHNNPPRTVEQAQAAKIVELNEVNAAKKAGHILLFGKEFFSSMLNANQIIQYQIALMTPVGFYINTVTGEQYATTLAHLLTLNAGIVELYLLCDQNYDALAIAIGELETVEEVDDFDIITNEDFPWPTVPFTPS